MTLMKVMDLLILLLFLLLVVVVEGWGGGGMNRCGSYKENYNDRRSLKGRKGGHYIYFISSFRFSFILDIHN